MFYKILNHKDGNWEISVTHFVFSSELDNTYSVFIKHKSNNWVWQDIQYKRNTLKSEILKLKRKILIQNRLKPSRIFKGRC